MSFPEGALFRLLRSQFDYRTRLRLGGPNGSPNKAPNPVRPSDGFGRGCFIPTHAFDTVSGEVRYRVHNVPSLAEALQHLMLVIMHVIN